MVYGGAEKQLVTLMKELSKQGNEVSIFTFYISDYYSNLLKNITNIHIMKFPFKKIFTKIPFVWPMIKFRNTIVGNNIFRDYDIINPHTYPSHWFCEGLKNKTVWTCNEPPMTYFPFRATNKLDFAIRCKIKKLLYKTSEVEMTKKSVGIICVLDKRIQSIVKDLYRVESRIVRSGVDTTIFKRLKKIKGHKIRVLFVSRLVPHKRLVDFLETMKIISKKYRNVEVCIVGFGPEEYLINSYKRKINNIIHLKNISDEELAKTYNVSDILIFPAVNQPWGLIPLEAMACGCATIVSKDTGVSEVLTHLRNSILIDPYKPEEIAKWVSYLFENPTELNRIKNNGYNFVRNNFTVKNYAKEMLKTYKDLIGEKA